METRKDGHEQPTRPQTGHEMKRKGLQIVKLEERIAPGIRMQNHNETLVREVG